MYFGLPPRENSLACYLPKPIVDDSMRVHRRRRREIARSSRLVWADSITQTGFPITRGELIDAVVYYAMLQRGNTWDGEIPSGVMIQEVQSVINRAFTLTENQRRFTLPQQIPHLSEVDKVSTFESANCAVTRDGKMFTWGTRKNQEGQLVTINIPTYNKFTHISVIGHCTYMNSRSYPRQFTYLQ